MTSMTDVGGFDGPRIQNHDELVWRQEDRWSWFSECGRYKIERFVGPDTGTDRYRSLARNPEWYGEVGNEPTLDDAKRVCQEALR